MGGKAQRDVWYKTSHNFNNNFEILHADATMESFASGPEAAWSTYLRCPNKAEQECFSRKQTKKATKPMSLKKFKF